MRIVFMGTPEFAVPSLERLIADGHDVLLVVTQPDKPVGRKQLMTPPPVKLCALAHGIPVFQPQSMKTDDVMTMLQQVSPELIVVAAYGKILPKAVLNLPVYGCINVHASLLPAYRGAAPIQWAVINGEKNVGVTIMQMNEGLDTGDMLLSFSRELPPDMTAGELHDLLSKDGARLLADTLEALERGTLSPKKQPSQGSYAPMLNRSFSPLDFTKPALVLHNQVRGLNPWPAASCILHDRLLKIYRTCCGGQTDAPVGTVCALDPLSVACGDGQSLCLLEVQYEGKQRMKSEAFLRGHTVAVGEKLR